MAYVIQYVLLLRLYMKIKTIYVHDHLSMGYPHLVYLTRFRGWLMAFYFKKSPRELPWKTRALLFDPLGSVSGFAWFWQQYLNPRWILGPLKPLTSPCVNRFISGLQKKMSSLRCFRPARRLMWWAHPLSQGRGFQKDWVDDNMVTRTPKWGVYSRLHDLALWLTVVLSFLSTHTLNPLTVDRRDLSITHLYLQQSRSWALRKQQLVSGKS